jgi:hypothetical protein
MIRESLPRAVFALALSLALGIGSDLAAQQRSARTKGTKPSSAAKDGSFSAEWAGQGREDRVGTGISVGPDGIADAKLVVRGLLKDAQIVGLVLKGASGLQWHSGANPDAFPSSELIRRGDDPTTGDLYFGPDRDIKGQNLALEIYYTNGQSAFAKVVAGKYDPKLAVGKTKVANLGAFKLTSRWIGQDGIEKVAPGDVHVAIEGLPRLPIVAAALSDSSRGLWHARISDKLPFDPGPDGLPMALIRGDDPSRADLHFPPFRDETGGKMTLRILFEDGRTAIAQFPGGKCDPGLRSKTWPAKTATTAKPGDDLNDLAAKFGTIRLSPGRYAMSAPLVLDKSVNIVGEPGATLVFSQKGGDPTWSAAILIHAGHTTLEGFAVRFDTPIRWTPGVEDGPAVIGVTDNFDTKPRDIKADLTFRKLDLEGPPATTKWEQGPLLMRMHFTVCGTIEDNTFKGGTIHVMGGPWRIVGNRHLGTQSNTYSYGVFSGMRTHDLLVKDNVVRPVADPTAKTWRFLVITQSGTDDRVEGNTVENVGPRDVDKLPSENAPEIILTEAYSLHFEGKPSAVSPDGRVVVVPAMQWDVARTGDAVAILTGPNAGQWRTVAQAMGPTTLLLEEPLPPGTGDAVLSIGTGFVRESFVKNTIDARGGGGIGCLVLVGNHFGLTVAENHFLGGRNAFKIAASPSENPVHWGWSHVPLMGATIEGNILEDSTLGGTLCVEHSPQTKTNKGRVYASVKLKDNTVRWSPAFAAKLASGGGEPPSGFILGDRGSLDPGEMIVQENNNQATSPGGIAFRVNAAKINGKDVRGKVIPLPAARSASR